MAEARDVLTPGTTVLLEQDLALSKQASVKSRFRQVVQHGSFVTLSDQVIVSLTNFSTGILIGHFCSKSELGLYMLGYSVLLFAVALQQMLISSPYILQWPRLEPLAAQQYTKSVYTEQTAFSLLLCAMLLVASLVARSSKPALSPVLLAFAFATPCFLVKEMFRRVCFTQLKAQVALLVDTGVGILQVSLLLLLWKNHHLSAATGVFCMGVANLFLAAGLALSSKDRTLSFTAVRDVFQQNWSSGRWIFGSQVLWAGCLYAYPWLITHLRGTEAAGTWAACFGINALGNPLLLGLQSYIEPRVAHAYASHQGRPARRIVWQATIVLLVSMLLFTGLIGVVGGKAIVTLYSAKYANNGLTVTLITLSYAIGAASFAFSCGFFASGKGKLDYRISWIYPVIFLSCGVPLVSRYGVVGGGLSIVIANSLSTVMRLLQFYVTFRDGQGSHHGANPAAAI